MHETKRMKRWGRGGAAALAALFGLLLAGAAHALPVIESWELPQGTRVLFVQSRALPMIDVQIDYPAGSAADPVGLAGLAGLTRGLLEAGAGGLSEDEVAERLADVGAVLGGGVDDDRFGISLRTLSSSPEREAAVDLLARVIGQPAFGEAALARERERALAQLRESLTRPDVVAARALTAAVYGGHPYGQLVSEASLKAIGREALVEFHRTRLVAATAVISIVGDLDRAGARQLAGQLAQAMPQGTAPVPVLADPEPGSRATIRLPHPSTQAHVLMGMPGMRRDDPDYFPLLVGNYILGGGGFVSRLMKVVREERGLAYSVYSSLMPMRAAGPFLIGLQTRGDQAPLAVGLVEEVLAGFVAEGPTGAELQAAKDNLVNGFGLRLDSNRKILDHVAMIGFYGLPLDWLARYPDAVLAVDREAVRDAFARRLPPARLMGVVVGGQGAEGEE